MRYLRKQREHPRERDSRACSRSSRILTDILCVRRDLSAVRNALGTELADERGEAKVLNGAVLMFDQGSPFIHECMARAPGPALSHATEHPRTARRFQLYRVARLHQQPAADSSATLSPASATRWSSTGPTASTRGAGTGQSWSRESPAASRRARSCTSCQRAPSTPSTGPRRARKTKSLGVTYLPACISSAVCARAGRRAAKRVGAGRLRRKQTAANLSSAVVILLAPTVALPVYMSVRVSVQVAKYFTDEDLEDQHKVWAEMERDTYLFHYWNKVTVTLRPKPGSLMYKARGGAPTRTAGWGFGCCVFLWALVKWGWIVKFWWAETGALRARGAGAEQLLHQVRRHGLRRVGAAVPGKEAEAGVVSAGSKQQRQGRRRPSAARG